MLPRRSVCPTVRPFQLAAAGIAAILLSLALPQKAAARVAADGAGITGAGEQLGFSPFVDWKTLTSDHFRISYPEGLQELAQVAAGHLEEAHRLLSPLLKWSPRHRTQVVLLDNSDFANGLAAAAGRFGIVLWSTPPDNWMSIAHYDDWFRMLCLHEYAHILNLDATNDFWKILRFFTGDMTLPNQFWPSWMLEGLAVTVETAFTKAGRGRSSYYSMLVRAAEEGGILSDPEGLWRIGGPRTDAPGGEIPYLFGSMLMSELSARDLNLLGKLSEESSKSLPWKLNTYAERVHGRNWSELWSDWQKQARERAQGEISEIHDAGTTRLVEITKGNYSTQGIAFSPDGKWMAYSREALDRRQGVYLRELATEEEHRVSDQLGGSSMSFTDDSQGLVFSRVDRHGLYDFFSDLWVHDLPTGRTQRLSSGARYRDPSAALQGQWLVYTVNETGRISLARSRLIRDSKGRYRLSEKEFLFRPQVLGRVATPRISPDGTRIVFSLHENGKVGESIWQMIRDPSVVGEAGFWREQRVTPEGEHFDRFPFFDAKNQMYFVSNRTGVDNVYRWNLLDSSAVAITNVTTGLWLPAFAPDGRLAASHYRATGWDAVWVDQQMGGSRPPRLLPISAPIPDTVVGAVESSPIEDPVKSSRKPPWTISDYSIFPSILPRAWTPYLGYGSLEGYVGGALLVGFDALDFHRYLAQLGGHFSLGEWDADVSYSNRSLGAVWTLYGSRRVNSLLNTAYTRRTAAGLGVSLYYPRTFSAWNPSLDFSWEREEYFAYPKFRSQLGAGSLATLISSPTMTAQVQYRGTQSSRQAVWPEEGFNFRLGNQWVLGGWMGSLGGRRVTASQALWTQQHYVHLGRHVVLSPRWQVSASNRTSVRLEGRSAQLLDSFASPDFDQLVVRGYPRQQYFARQAGVGALDLRFPLRRVEKGWSTYPIYLTTLEGLGFLENSFHREGVVGSWTRLPSWGVGALATMTVFYSVPISASVQFHHGVESGQGGRGEVFVDLRLGQLSF